MRNILFLTVLLFASSTVAKLYQVGPTRTYTKPSKVMNLVSDGDTVEIDAGLYTGDVGTWTKNNLVIRAAGRGLSGFAHLEAAGQNAGGKAIWVITGKNTYIENIEFSGCTVPDHNGAGIRQEGAGLELRHCYFHDNEDGVLAGANLTSDILFEACEFARNGYGDGFSHNMYIGNIRTFTMRFCYSHHAKVGHCVKSRAMNNFIEYNRIMDEDTGSASYLINLPNGGFSIVLGNTMMKGVSAQNRTLVDYGSEGLTNPSKQLYVASNTMVSTRPGGATFVNVANGTDTAKIINNIFAGPGLILSGAADTITNSYSAKYQFDFLNFTKYDFRLVGDIIYPPQPSAPGYAGIYALTPAFEYVHPEDSIARKGLFLVGAFENDFGAVSLKPSIIHSFNYPNPFSEKTTIDLGTDDGSPVVINIFNQLGEKNLTENAAPENSQLVFERGNLAGGVYYYEIEDSKGVIIAAGKFVIF
ncbi:MAG: right-handed parallel beta-helix repeat-containing protein [Candidatus Kapaibacterium sp.]